MYHMTASFADWREGKGHFNMFQHPDWWNQPEVSCSSVIKTPPISFISSILQYFGVCEATWLSEIGNMENKENPEKIFKCDMCEYATSRACSLKRHVMTVHKKVKNFKCDLCDYLIIA